MTSNILTHYHLTLTILAAIINVTFLQLEEIIANWCGGGGLSTVLLLNRISFLFEFCMSCRRKTKGRTHAFCLGVNLLCSPCLLHYHSHSPLACPSHPSHLYPVFIPLLFRIPRSLSLSPSISSPPFLHSLDLQRLRVSGKNAASKRFWCIFKV